MKLYWMLAVFVAANGAAAEVECLIEPNQTVELRAPVEGLIEAIHVDRGDRVKVGQLLVELDAGVEKAAVELARFRADATGALHAAESRVEFTKQKLARAEGIKRDAISQADKDQARAEQKLAEGELQQALEERRMAGLELRRAEQVSRLKQLRSPIDGIVSERFHHPGEVTEGGRDEQPILELIAVDPLYVEVVLPAGAFGSVAKGQVISLTQTQPNPRELKATVRVIDEEFDAATDTFRVRMVLPNPKGEIVAGGRCSAHIENTPESEP